MLALIARKPRYGYEIIKAIEERTGGSYSPSPGVVYPTLTMLEELGQATITASEDGKKLYAITPAGTSMLEASRTTLDAIERRTAAAGAAFGGAAKAPLMRAMENLRLAVRLRMARGPLGEEQARAIAAVIDRAALEVERS
jgi:DNA-binding PadR family transcriptional regulator